MAEEEPLDQFPISGYDYSVGSLTEEEYRQWIEHTFRHVFEPYNQIGGIPCRELLSRFQYRGYGLPQDRRKDLMLYLDANRDGRITYEVMPNCMQQNFGNKATVRVWAEIYH